MIKLWRDWIASAVVVLAALGLGYLGLNRPGPWGGSARGPRTVAEAVAVATALGLNYVSCRNDGLLTDSVVLSEPPVSYDTAATLVMGRPEDPRWVGRVLVVRGWRSLVVSTTHDPEHAAVWGEVYLYGDPHLIRRLTGAVACAGPRVG